MRIAFFGHDANDATIAKRVKGFLRDGHQVQGFMMFRGSQNPWPWPNINLGQSHDARFLHRLYAVERAVGIVRKNCEELEACDVIYARNPDMLLCAVRAMARLKMDKPLIYECLDIHHLMTRKDLIGKVARAGEARLMKKVSLVVLSSPAFQKNYFGPHYPGAEHWLVENRLLAQRALPPRPVPALATCPLKIGWFGVLRCRRSFELLRELAALFPEQVEIVLRGKLAKTAVGDLAAEIDRIPNMSYHGPYRAPEGLQEIYRAVDLVWAGDFFQAGYNSEWLLPNRLYEGGYFNVPPIAPMQSQTGRWIKDRDVGYLVEEPISTTLPVLIRELIENRSSILTKAQNQSRLPLETFLEPQNALTEMLSKATTIHKARA